MVRRIRFFLCLACLCVFFCCSVSAFDGTFLGLSPRWSSFIDFPAYGNSLEKEVNYTTLNHTVNSYSSTYKYDYVTCTSGLDSSSTDYYVPSSANTVSLYYSGCNVVSDDGIISVTIQGVSNKWSAPSGYFCYINSSGNFVYENATRLSWSRSDSDYTSNISMQFATDVTPGVWPYFVVYMTTNGGALTHRVNNVYKVTTTYHHAVSGGVTNTLSYTDSEVPSSTRAAGVVSSISYDLPDEASKMIVEDMAAKKDTAEDIGGATTEETISDTQETLNSGLSSLYSGVDSAGDIGSVSSPAGSYGVLLTSTVTPLLSFGNGVLLWAIYAVLIGSVILFIMRRLK